MPRTFTLLETLGEGAHGAVFLARVEEDEGFVQTLAVKCLHPRWTADVDLARRLRDEARLLALLDHVHVVRVHGLTRIEGRLAIMMEAVRGADLSRTDGHPVPPRAAAEIVEAVADALDAAWRTVPAGQTDALRVVHRDIKPSNVMVTDRGAVKVMDFGVARARFDHREAATRSQQFGTARYMAPERWLHGRAEASSDVYSLGITLAEMVGGKPIDAPRLAPEQFASDVAEALDALRPWPGLHELATRMCDYDPDARPSSAEVASEAARLAASLPEPGLRAWSAEWVPAMRATSVSTDEATGTVMREDSSAATFLVTQPNQPPPAAVPQSRRVVSAGWLLVGVAALSLGWAAARGVRPAERRALASPAAPGATAAVEPAVPELPAEAAAEASSPAPAPGRAVPATSSVARVRDRVAAEPTPEPPPPVVGAAQVIFDLRPADMTVRSGDLDIPHQRPVRLPEGVVSLRATGAGVDFRCTIRVRDELATWRVDAASGSCWKVK